MKKFKNLYLSAAIVLLGVGAAFATSNTKSASDTVPGYLMESGQCIEKRSNCSTTGTEFCTWTDANNQSHNLSGTNCILPLYEPSAR
nr:DUF6520 family protein [uncultured Draconibacterium sp.]